MGALQNPSFSTRVICNSYNEKVAKQMLFSNNCIHIYSLCPYRVLFVKWGLKNTSFGKERHDTGSFSTGKYPMCEQEEGDYFYEASVLADPAALVAFMDHCTDPPFSQMWQLSQDT